jgi:hypothetical protein
MLNHFGEVAARWKLNILAERLLLFCCTSSTDGSSFVILVMNLFRF